MGLEKNLLTSTGLVGNYHRIKHLTIDMQRGKSFISVETFADYEKRSQGHKPLDTYGIEMVLDPSHAQMIYDILKQWPTFEGATDRIEVTPEPEENVIIPEEEVIL